MKLFYTSDNYGEMVLNLSSVKACYTEEIIGPDVDENNESVFYNSYNVCYCLSEDTVLYDTFQTKEEMEQKFEEFKKAFREYHG